MKFEKFPSEFHAVMGSVDGSDAMYKFLQNIFHLFPEDRFHTLIKQGCKASKNDETIYRFVQKNLSSIKPFLADLRFALPALFKQKREMAQQTLQLLGNVTSINGYVEIGSLGRYVSELRKHLRLSGRVLLVDEKKPGYSPPEIMERGQLGRLGQHVAMAEYAPLVLDANSVDLITCYIGLHHAPLDRLNEFIVSIARTLRPGGRFILRDHDVGSAQMNSFVCNIHTVFNLGLGESWENDNAELRYFRPIDEWVSMLDKLGLKDSGARVLQAHDPSANTLLCFTKRAS